MKDRKGEVPASCGVPVVFFIWAVVLGLYYGPALGLGRILGAVTFGAGYLAVLVVIVGVQILVEIAVDRTRRLSVPEHVLSTLPMILSGRGLRVNREPAAPEDRESGLVMRLTCSTEDASVAVSCWRDLYGLFGPHEGLVTLEPAVKSWRIPGTVRRLRDEIEVLLRQNGATDRVRK